MVAGTGWRVVTRMHKRIEMTDAGPYRHSDGARSKRKLAGTGLYPSIFPGRSTHAFRADRHPYRQQLWPVGHR